MNISATQLTDVYRLDRIAEMPDTGGDGKRILIVEGQAVGSPFKDAVLKQQHFILVGHSTSGQDAVRDALSLRPDLILMDVQLPGGMSGTTAAREIQSRESIPVIFMSSGNECDMLAAAGGDTVYGYLRRPFSDDELLICIRMALSRFELEKKLLESEKKFRLVFDQETDAIIIFDTASRTIADVNDAVLGLYSYTREELIGKDLMMLMDSSNCDNLYNAFRAQNTGSPFILLRQDHRTKTGMMVPVACRGRIIDINGRQHLFCSFRDITEKLLKEEEEVLIQVQLLHSEKMASIGVLAMGIAHEINNPLAFISSNLLILDKYLKQIWRFVGCLSKQLELCGTDAVMLEVQNEKDTSNIDYVAQDSLDLVAESTSGSERIKKIVQDLMLFTRSDGVDPELFDMHDCIENTINIIWNELKYKAKLEKQYGDIPPILGFKQKFSQVLMNLLVNASHAIEKEGVITIKTWSKDPDVFVSIADTGCGIGGENLKKIFEPFFTTKDAGKGSGLGLSIVYDIVTKKLNGDISVKSLLEAGTIFTVRLPIEYVTPELGAQ